MKPFHARPLAILALAIASTFALHAQPADVRQKADPVFVDYGPRAPAEMPLQKGVIFGSIALSAPDADVSALSLHLIPLEPGRHKVELFVTTRTMHPRFRAPDVDTSAERVWTFSGAIPEGKYLMRLAGISGADMHVVQWIEIKPELELTIAAGATIYIGRWQVTQPGVEVPEPRVPMPGTPFMLRDVLKDDRALLKKRGQEVPDPIDDAPIALFGPRA